MIDLRTTAAALGLFALVAGCGGGEPEIEEQSIEPEAPGQETLPMEMEQTSAPVYVGAWAADEDACSVAPGSAVPSPVAFTEEEFIGYENRCRIADTLEGTEGGYQLTLSCVGEGVEYQETVELDVDGEMLRMRRESGDETVFVRCPEEELLED